MSTTGKYASYRRGQEILKEADFLDRIERAGSHFLIWWKLSIFGRRRKLRDMQAHMHLTARYFFSLAVE